MPQSNNSLAVELIRTARMLRLHRSKTYTHLTKGIRRGLGMKALRRLKCRIRRRKRAGTWDLRMVEDT